MPVALDQLAANPAPLPLVAAIIIALATLSGLGWALLYDSSTIQGTATSFLAGLTSMTFGASLLGLAMLLVLLVARPLLRVRLGFLALGLLVAGLVWCFVALGSYAQVW